MYYSVVVQRELTSMHRTRERLRWASESRST